MAQKLGFLGLCLGSLVHDASRTIRAARHRPAAALHRNLRAFGAGNPARGSRSVARDHAQMVAAGRGRSGRRASDVSPAARRAARPAGAHAGPARSAAGRDERRQQIRGTIPAARAAQPSGARIRRAAGAVARKRGARLSRARLSAALLRPDDRRRRSAAGAPPDRAGDRNRIAAADRGGRPRDRRGRKRLCSRDRGLQFDHRDR